MIPGCGNSVNHTHRGDRPLPMVIQGMFRIMVHMRPDGFRRRPEPMRATAIDSWCKDSSLHFAAVPGLRQRQVDPG